VSSVSECLRAGRVECAYFSSIVGSWGTSNAIFVARLPVILVFPKTYKRARSTVYVAAVELVAGSAYDYVFLIVPLLCGVRQVDQTHASCVINVP